MRDADSYLGTRRYQIPRLNQTEREAAVAGGPPGRARGTIGGRPSGPPAAAEIINYIKICHPEISDELESIICLK